MKWRHDGVNASRVDAETGRDKKKFNSSHSFFPWEWKRFILSCVDFALEARAGCNKSNIV